MSFPKLLVIIATVLFSAVIVAAIIKGNKEASEPLAVKTAAPVEVEPGKDLRAVPAAIKPALTHVASAPLSEQSVVKATQTLTEQSEPIKQELPNANRIEEFFNTEGPKLPIVETIIYKSRVPWQKGRPAWLSDYASHYKTSRHFIARSLNGKPDYFKQDLAEADHFNVLRQDKNFQFHLVIDLSRCRLWFYYDDLDKHERVLLKTYLVGVGRIDATKKSGFLTPLGKYSLGNKVVVYKPGMKGFHNGEQVEMMTVFGTRWIPFDKEISGCTAPAKGFGLHGTPWTKNAKGEFIEERSSLGKYQSDGCIRLASEDVEELFAIIITKPTLIELVKDFFDASATTMTLVPTVEK